MPTMTDQPNATYLDEALGLTRDIECYNSLSTTVSLHGPDGVEINPTLMATNTATGGKLPTWEEIPEGSKIQWSALTKSDGKAKADRINLELTVFDMNYVAQNVNKVMNELTEEETAMLLTDTGKIMDIIYERATELTKPELTLKTIWSDTLHTNENGKADGEIIFPPQWPKGAYNLTIHYGYHSQSEKPSSDKAYDFWVEDMGPTIVSMVIAAVIMLIPGVNLVGGAYWAFVGAEILADLAIMYVKFQQDMWGIVGQDQYGCDFPYESWMHTYAMGLQTREDLESLQDDISPMNTQLLTATESYIETQGMVNSIVTGSVILALFLMLLAKGKKKRGKTDG